MKPIIGVTGNAMEIRRDVDVTNFAINYSPRSFTKVIEKTGGIPIIIPITDYIKAEEYIQLIDGLLLAGGQDISPHLYNEEPRQVINEISPQRDANEIALIQAALKHNKPILAICRGMQLINVYFGGNLYQDLTENDDITIQHVQRSLPHIATHSINIKEGSNLYNIMGPVARINSFHHQVINQLADELTATAYSSDQVIEAFESDQHNIVAVQWHPELMYETSQESMNLFKDLIERSKK